MANEPDEVNSGALATIIVLVFVATLAVALVVTALVRDETARLQADGSEAQSRAFQNLKNEQLTKLNAAAGWVDRENGIAKVPLESAKKIVLSSVAANPLALSPGNPPEEEEEEAEEGSEEASQEDSAGEEAEAEGAESAVEKAAAAEEKKKAAPLAPAVKAPAVKAPAGKAPAAPAPGGPAE